MHDAWMAARGYSKARAGEHLKKLNGSHEKVLDSINPCGVCRRVLGNAGLEHLDIPASLGNQQVMRRVFFQLRIHTRPAVDFFDSP